MKPALKASAALVAALLPISLASPAFAVAYDRLSITVDCVLGEPNEDDHVIAPGEVLNVTFTNCNGLTIEDEDGTGNATMSDNTVIVSGNTQTISSNNFVVTVDGEADLEVDDDDPDVEVYVAGPVDDPSSTLLATEEITIDLSASETMVREEMIGDPEGDDGGGDIFIAGKEECQVEPGLHVYEALEFTVTSAGTYDFRAIAVSPIDEDLNWGVDTYPTTDPFLAVYETFNPALPETGVVGCNDDNDDTGTPAIDDAWEMNPDYDFEGLVTEAGNILHDQWPWFRTTLEPGNYTIVYMPFSTMGSADFAAGQYGLTSDDNGDTWDPIAQSTTYEMWGPAGGIIFGEELATTGGVEPSFALWAGIGVLGVGVAVAVARRREQRA
jgi:hypothetical protein